MLSIGPLFKACSVKRPLNSESGGQNSGSRTVTVLGNSVPVTGRPVQERDRKVGGTMARTPEDRTESPNGDLRGLLDNKKVPKEIQAEPARRGIDSTEMLAVLADDREGLREAATERMIGRFRSSPLASLLRRSGGRDWPVPCRG